MVAYVSSIGQSACPYVLLPSGSRQVVLRLLAFAHAFPPYPAQH